MDGSLPGFSVHGISQARILEGVAISFSRGSFQPRNQTHVSYTGSRILYHWATTEALEFPVQWIKKNKNKKHKKLHWSDITVKFPNIFNQLSEKKTRTHTHTHTHTHTRDWDLEWWLELEYLQQPYCEQGNSRARSSKFGRKKKNLSENNFQHRTL